MRVLLSYIHVYYICTYDRLPVGRDGTVGTCNSRINSGYTMGCCYVLLLTTGQFYKAEKQGANHYLCLIY